MYDNVIGVVFGAKKMPNIEKKRHAKRLIPSYNLQLEKGREKQT